MKKKTNKLIFLHGLGNRKECEILFPYFNVPQIDWINGSLAKLKLGKPKTLVGFSMGAVVACDHALKHKVDHLVLCSPTPCIETLKDIKTKKVTFIVGEKEAWVYEQAMRIAHTLKCPWDMVIVPETGHKINIKYLNAILEVI